MQNRAARRESSASALFDILHRDNLFLRREKFIVNLMFNILNI